MRPLATIEVSETDAKDEAEIAEALNRLAKLEDEVGDERGVEYYRTLRKRCLERAERISLALRAAKDQ